MSKAKMGGKRRKREQAGKISEKAGKTDRSGENRRETGGGQANGTVTLKGDVTTKKTAKTNQARNGGLFVLNEGESHSNSLQSFD